MFLRLHHENPRAGGRAFTNTDNRAVHLAGARVWGGILVPVPHSAPPTTPPVHFPGALSGLPFLTHRAPRLDWAGGVAGGGGVLVVVDSLLPILLCFTLSRVQECSPVG